MILLDTTVLAYVVGEEHALRAPSRWLLATHGEGRIDVTTTVEVLQELLNIRSRRRPRPEAVALTRELAAAFDVWVTSPADLLGGCGLFERYPSLARSTRCLGPWP